MRLVVALALALGFASSCGSDEDDVSTYAIGGVVSEMTGRGLVLFMKGEYLELWSAGPFEFETRIADGRNYSIAVAEQPVAPRQLCTLTNPRGTVNGADVADVEVVCVDAIFEVGGTVSGLEGSGLLLQNNGREVLAVEENGPFRFSMPVEEGAPYRVRVFAQPSDPDQICTVARAGGTIARADVTNVAVSCSTTP